MTQRVLIRSMIVGDEPSDQPTTSMDVGGDYEIDGENVSLVPAKRWLSICKGISFLLDETPLILRPLLAMELGIEGALFREQLQYWTRKSKQKHNGQQVARFSYTRWHRQFPFISRRTLIAIVRRLESSGHITVHRTGRVNLLRECDISYTGEAASILSSIDPNSAYDLRYLSPLPVFPTLAKAVGLIPAIILQQIHRRCPAGDWAIKSYEQWKHDCLMFISISTIKRAFVQLKTKQLIVVKRYRSSDGMKNAYRINYSALATLLSEYPATSPTIDWDVYNQRLSAARAATTKGTILTGVDKAWITYRMD